MFMFFLKKSFYFAWDNMFILAAYNIFVLLIGVLCIWLFSVLDQLYIRILILLFFSLAFSVWSGAAAYAFKDIVNYKPFDKGKVKKGFAWAIKPGLEAAAILSIVGFSSAFVFPFYASVGGFLGLLALGLSFWLYLGLGLIILYFMPVRVFLDCGFIESVKMSFAILVDSPFTALLLAIYSILCMLLSPLLAFLLPGAAAAMLGLLEAVRLRLMRFDWLRAGRAAKGPTPWKELLLEDSELVGKRSFRDLIFPWKT